MVTLFDRFGPLQPRKGSPETTLDCFAHIVTTTVLESWEVFSCCRKVSAYRRKFFYVVGTAACYFRGYLKLRGCIFFDSKIVAVNLIFVARNQLGRREKPGKKNVNCAIRYNMHVECILLDLPRTLRM